MRVEIGIPRVCLGWLLLSVDWILLYSANDDPASAISFSLPPPTPTPPAFSFLRLLRYYPPWEYFSPLSRSVFVFFVFTQIMPRGTHLGVQVQLIQRPVIRWVLPNSLLCPGGAVWAKWAWQSRCTGILLLTGGNAVEEKRIKRELKAEFVGFSAS